ncbi:MAG: cation transporter [Isosphaeraceae bacterium]|nr:cation transporter [Isosphaeraceae bacterium]
MRVQVLYFQDCPNHLPTVGLVKDAVAGLGLDAPVEEIEVKRPDEAQRLQFLGSPSVRVNGVDIEPAARGRTDFGFCCRTYNGQGIPPRALVEQALKGCGPSSGDACCAPSVSSPSARTGGRTERWAALGSVISAVVASACCWLPLLFLAFGLSAAGASAMFERVRPFFLLVAAGLLGTGFYLSYVRKESCEPGQACGVPNLKLRRFNRAMLWVAAAVVIAVALFPYYAGVLVGGATEALAGQEGTGLPTMTLTVKGMTCEACAAHIQKELAKVPGVKRASVRYDQGQAAVAFDPHSPPDTKALLDAAERAGYKAMLAVDAGKKS